MKKRSPTHGDIFSKQFNKKPEKVKILLFDLETSPSLGYSWAKWETDIIEFERDWYILSFAYKWLGGKTKTIALPDFPRYRRNPKDDRFLVKALWSLFNEADITIAHNNKGFDTKKANTRFIQLGLPPPAPHKTFDTLQVVKKHFRFDSNKLDDLGKYLGIGRKVETGGYALWRECMRGNLRAWKKLKKYNKQDVELLEKLYLKLRPWMSDVHSASDCPKCGGKLQRRGTRRTIGKEYQRYQCISCAGWSSDRTGRGIKKPKVSL